VGFYYGFLVALPTIYERGMNNMNQSTVNQVLNVFNTQKIE